MRLTIMGQRREDRARRTFAAGLFAAALPVVVQFTTAMIGWSLRSVVTATAVAAVVSAAVVGTLLLRLSRSMEREAARFENERRRWRDEAFTDPLCGIANRRGAAHEIEFRRLIADPADRLWVMALDVDRFKKVNDDHGHAVGDRVLVAVAEVLADRLPAGAVVARWGGDEFVVFQMGGHELVDGWGAEIAEAVAAHPIPVREGELRVSVSFGLADGPVNADFEHLLDEADDALLRAKQRLVPAAPVTPPVTAPGTAPVTPSITAAPAPVATTVDVRELAPSHLDR